VYGEAITTSPVQLSHPPPGAIQPGFTAMRTVMVSVTRIPPHLEYLPLTLPEYPRLVEPVSLALNGKYLLLAEGVEALKVAGSQALTRIQQ
jgi:hypothetical protein